MTVHKYAEEIVRKMEAYRSFGDQIWPRKTALAIINQAYVEKKIRQFYRDKVSVDVAFSELRHSGWFNRGSEFAEPNVPNLDDMSPKDLMAFWSRYHRPTLKDARALVGRRRNYTNLASALANYAANKATAINERFKGNITNAEMYERYADNIYDKLPKDLQW